MRDRHLVGYSADDLAWLASLQRLRATGMAIRDMQCFADLRRQGHETVPARRELLEAHRDEVLERIAELQRALAAVTDKITHDQHPEIHPADHRHPDRYARGREKLAEVDGSAGEAVVDSLGDLRRHIVEYAFGDVYTALACPFATASWPPLPWWLPRAAASRSSTCTCTPPATSA